MRDRLNDDYFEWMYQLVCNDRYYKNLSYRKLLYFLHDTEFVYIIERDSNRAVEGVDLRNRFGREVGYSSEDIEKYLGDRPCSVLEMIIALAFEIEICVMDDPLHGDRTGQWFWNMIVNLGLGGMSDSRFDERYADEVIVKFLSRGYSPKGEGGLFTVHNPLYDMRDAEIWYQAMWYLDENFDFSV